MKETNADEVANEIEKDIGRLEVIVDVLKVEGDVAASPGQIDALIIKGHQVSP